MITPSVWSAGSPAVRVTEPSGLAAVVSWLLIDTDGSDAYPGPLTFPGSDLYPGAGGSATVVAAGGVDSVTDTTVMFTPTGAPVGLYTVALVTAAGTEAVRYVDAFAVVAPTPPDLPDGISVEWIDAWGAVRFAATDLGPNDTVKIAGPGGNLIPIRGYETADWHEGSTVGFGYAFEMPLGVLVSFKIVDAARTTYVGGDSPYASITTPEGRAWLRDLHQPLLSLEVAVAATTETRTARQTAHKVAGRPAPIVRWDVREARQGTITLRVENTYNGLWLTTFRDRLDLLLDSGRPLLLSMCHTKGFPPCYMAVGDVRYPRLGTRARWAVELDYLEVDNPTFVDVIIPAEVTWEQAMQIPPGATWADWASTTWLDIATRTSL